MWVPSVYHEGCGGSRWLVGFIPTWTTCWRHDPSQSTGRNILLASYTQLSVGGTFWFLVPCIRKLHTRPAMTWTAVSTFMRSHQHTRPRNRNSSRKWNNFTTGILGSNPTGVDSSVALGLLMSPYEGRNSCAGHGWSRVKFYHTCGIMWWVQYHRRKLKITQFLSNRSWWLVTSSSTVFFTEKTIPTRILEQEGKLLFLQKREFDCLTLTWFFKSETRVLKNV